ncbi:hypothetical protein [Sphingomonas sp. ID0503]|uniref:hypothetical protein n=1 Tax=Sphingomonas sp. ID0503 TaxID=3399691 RepID=UPI003AFB64F0
MTERQPVPGEYDAARTIDRFREENSMTDVPKPIIVNPSILPETGVIAIRYFAALLAGWLIRKGYLTGADEPLITGLLLAVAAAGWAFWNARRKKAEAVTLAQHTPDSVGRVK